MEYKFKYKKNWFWKTKKIVGHRLKDDRMDLFLKDGSIFSIGEWHRYGLFLGTDWLLVTKTNMEKESGQDIKLNV